MDERLTELRARKPAARVVPGLVYLVVFGAAIAFGVPAGGIGVVASWGVIYLVMAFLPEPRLFVSEHDLVVRGRRGQEQSYAWSSMHHTSWGTVGFGRSGPFVTPEGRPYDVPGPNAPALVATWFVPSRDLRRQFAAASEEHGVPFEGRRPGKAAAPLVVDS